MSLDFSFIYPHDALYAWEHGEREQYFAFRNANIACKQAIEQALSQHYGDNRLSTVKAAQDVIGEWGIERVMYVLAATIRQLDWDGRISRRNKEWARTIPVVDTNGPSGPYSAYCQVSSHPGLVDMLVTEVRHQALLRQPLVPADIEREATRLLEKLRGERYPNSSDGKHYMAEIDRDFLCRAGSKDLDALLGRFRFSSLCFTTLDDRSGRYAVIRADEDRSKPLRKTRNSVRTRLTDAPAEAPHTKPRKRGQER